MSLHNDPVEQEDLSNHVPVEYVIEWIRRRLALSGVRNRVLIVKAETASGKSTMLPGELYTSLIHPASSSRPGILCTQPRTLTAIRNIPEILGIPKYAEILKLGENTGWSTRFNKLIPPKNGLLSATIGTIRQQFLMSEDKLIMSKYKIVIIDEVHERDLETDVTLMLLKRFLVRNENNVNCPFILLSSATIQPELFANYFDVDVSPHENYQTGDCFKSNFVWCVGRSFGIDKKWDWNQGRTVSNYIRTASDVVDMIIKNPPEPEAVERSDILIFFPGKGQMTRCVDDLTKLQTKLIEEGKDYFMIALVDSDGQRNESDDFKVLSEPLENMKHRNSEKAPTRRVILSTNIAETGLTLHALKYVIDAGFNKEVIFYSQYGASCLITAPAAKSRITQRMGRAGRKFKGFFYPLYPEYIFDKLQTQQYASITLSDVSTMLLKVIYEQIRHRQKDDEEFAISLSDLGLIEMPSVESMRYSVQKLYSLGFLSYDVRRVDIHLFDMLKNANELLDPRLSLTRMGVLAATISMVNVECIRMILSGFFWKVAIFDLVSIAAYLTDSDRMVADSTKAIQWSEVYARALGIPLEKAEEIRYFIADDFINGIVLVTAVRKIITGLQLNQGYAALQEWLERVNIGIGATIGLIQRRDEIISDLFVREIAADAYFDSSLAYVKPEGIPNYVTAVKHCIHDGFRMNLLMFDGESYKTMKGIPVVTKLLADKKVVGEKLKQTILNSKKPRSMLYSKLDVKQKFNGDFYASAADVSMMDGFVNYDFDWMTAPTSRII